jgi:hypothetical protein
MPALVLPPFVLLIPEPLPPLLLGVLLPVPIPELPVPIPPVAPPALAPPPAACAHATEPVPSARHAASAMLLELNHILFSSRKSPAAAVGRAVLLANARRQAGLLR